ncbi:hypothetical protein DMP17_44290 [Pseudonocardia sp. TMWB2A]|uniref:hypothetical protein n=1 Tax=Pseudonocardia sp. TMWB2A TaxID=687430 RepID=UPI00307F6D29
MIGGKVLDASALAALVRGHLGAVAWIATARQVGIALYLPSLALTEVRAVLPESGPQLAELIGHPSVIVSELDVDAAAAVTTLLDHADAFDALAGHVVYTARQRGWPALSADPDRLTRLNPGVEITLL